MYYEGQCGLGPFSVLANGDSGRLDGATGLLSRSRWPLSCLAGSAHRRSVGCRLNSIRHTRSAANNATVTRSEYRPSPLCPCRVAHAIRGQTIPPRSITVRHVETSFVLRPAPRSVIESSVGNIGPSKKRLRRRNASGAFPEDGTGRASARVDVIKHPATQITRTRRPGTPT